MNKKVLIIQRRMTEYRVPLFDGMRERLAEKGIELKVVYSHPTKEDAERNDTGFLAWGIEVPCRCLKVGRTRLFWESLPKELLKDQDLLILPQENSLLINYYILFSQELYHDRLAFWGHGSNFQRIKENIIGRKLKAYTSTKVDWWFAYTDISVRKVVSYGFPEERITCLNNAVDTTNLLKWRKEISDEELSQVRNELRISGANTAAFVGSFSRDKRLDFLFQAVDALKRKIPDFELIIIGDGPLRAEVVRFSSERPWVKWVGHKRGREKVLFLALGKVLLNPGLVGLSILDSFALGVPMITTDCKLHSPEIAYMRYGRNGIMTKDDVSCFVDTVAGIMLDGASRSRMSDNCRESARLYSLEKMSDRFCDGIEAALSAPQKRVAVLGSGRVAGGNVPVTRHVAVIWQRFLPYHKARLSCLKKRLEEKGCRLTAIEVASHDVAYDIVSDDKAGYEGFDWVCCFRNSSYHDQSARQIHAEVFRTLEEFNPDIVFCPATPFPEGMAAIAYRTKYRKRVIMMDDAWERTDRRSVTTKRMKREIHKNIEGVFIPAVSHHNYYGALGFPDERVVYGVDVVDNDYYRQRAGRARGRAEEIRNSLHLPASYFLFVGRFLARKGIDTLLEAYRSYRSQTAVTPWGLVLVGDGPYRGRIRQEDSGREGVLFAGSQTGDGLCAYYGLAEALIVPSLSDPWGLVVNEGMASGLPVVVSRGCGSSMSLVKEGVNGWTFDPGDAAALSDIMLRLSETGEEARRKMGEKSLDIISEWSLQKFADGAIKALNIPRRQVPVGLITRVLTSFWKGHVRVN
ncbi:MAG: glycosyltransferase family 4 protein [Dissulfurispiraceae bacterium]